MNTKARDFLVTRLEKDLLGPMSIDEVIKDRPSDRYLTGMLYPKRLPYNQEQTEKLEVEGATENDANSTTEDTIPNSKIARPSSAGLSFAVDSNNKSPEINITIYCGTYTVEEKGEGELWQRIDYKININNLSIPLGVKRISLAKYGLKGLELYFQSTAWESYYLITVALVNISKLPPKPTRNDIDLDTFFQTSLKITASGSSKLIARPSRNISVKNKDIDDDNAMANLIYRNAKEFAVGHTSSATWSAGDQQEFADYVSTTWIPQTTVYSTSSEGDDVFKKLSDTDDNPLSSSWLASNTGEKLSNGLNKLTYAYEEWLTQQNARIASLSNDDLKTQARKHLDDCAIGLNRMKDAISLIAEDEEVEAAFRLANKAMFIQRRWAFPDSDDLIWRPFQLGFLLLSLGSTAVKDHPDREVMDLIWFPTGGGKTEAYLALSAFILFYRRIHYQGNEKGSGVSILMRYTLRLLTTQQFQRATSLIFACEYLRNDTSLRPTETVDINLGNTTFSIGLWVGEGSTPNKFEDIASGKSQGTYKQLTNCPCCHSELTWKENKTKKAIIVSCKNASCELSKSVKNLPVWTVDTDIYREKPSLVIGTVDKFAQIVRKPETGILFGINTEHCPPDLIIQDELHLISGPLGTMAACYEIAIDELCTRNKIRPKIIGSTATIRRASEQIRALFNRETYQFPAPGIDADNSGFAIRDNEAPGRLYIGLTTAGKSAKFSLQATSATLLQGASAKSLTDDERDPYWTLVAYFNSLRELGGALVLMQDDVPASMEEYSKRYKESPREIYETTELTSRIDSAKIPEILSELENKYSSDEAHDILLASNMISVGVDISRLGLMIVNGQPKGMAEYIQATSRVGRGVIPGLVVTLYNAAKTRDRSHFEAFSTWHNTLYRDVEASSVTPFASRARDRTLHGILVALVRHLIPNLATSPKLTAKDIIEIKKLFSVVTDRANQIDSSEIKGIEEFLSLFVEEWERKESQYYWNDWKPKNSLLISAEKEAEIKAAGYISGARPVPNSLRTVEPSTNFYLVERLKGKENTNAS